MVEQAIAMLYNQDLVAFVTVCNHNDTVHEIPSSCQHDRILQHGEEALWSHSADSSTSSAIQTNLHHISPWAGQCHQNMQQQQVLLSRQLQLALRMRLPAYMIPSAVISLDSIPVTSSGKVNKRELEEWADNYFGLTERGSTDKNTFEREVNEDGHDATVRAETEKSVDGGLGSATVDAGLRRRECARTGGIIRIFCVALLRARGVKVTDIGRSAHSAGSGDGLGRGRQPRQEELAIEILGRMHEQEQQEEEETHLEEEMKEEKKDRDQGYDELQEQEVFPLGSLLQLAQVHWTAAAVDSLGMLVFRQQLLAHIAAMLADALPQTFATMQAKNGKLIRTNLSQVLDAELLSFHSQDIVDICRELLLRLVQYRSPCDHSDPTASLLVHAVRLLYDDSVELVQEPPRTPHLGPVRTGSWAVTETSSGSKRVGTEQEECDTNYVFNGFDDGLSEISMSYIDDSEIASLLPSHQLTEKTASLSTHHSLLGLSRCHSAGHGGQELQSAVATHVSALIRANVGVLEGLRGWLTLLVLYDHFHSPAVQLNAFLWGSDTLLFVVLSGFTTGLQHHSISLATAATATVITAATATSTAASTGRKTDTILHNTSSTNTSASSNTNTSESSNTNKSACSNKNTSESSNTNNSASSNTNTSAHVPSISSWEFHRQFLASRAWGVLPIEWLALLLHWPRWRYHAMNSGGDKYPPAVHGVCAGLYAIGMQSWWRPQCAETGPNDTVYASLILNCYIFYSISCFLGLLSYNIDWDSFRTDNNSKSISSSGCSGVTSSALGTSALWRVWMKWCCCLKKQEFTQVTSASPVRQALVAGIASFVMVFLISARFLHMKVIRGRECVACGKYERLWEARSNECVDMCEILNC